MPHSSWSGPIARVLVLVLAFAGVALGDVIHLKDGNKLEGEIVKETDASVSIKTRFGKIDVERGRIERIERKLTPRQEYDQRRRALADDDVSGRFELAIFCKENRLKKESKKLLQEILKIDPQHDGANREFGRISYRGQWFTKDELKKFKASEKAEMEARGLVLHDGKWMTEEEALEAQGFIQVDGQWLSREEADRLLAARDFEKVFGVPLTISDSEHFSLRNTRTDEDNDYLLNIFEAAYDYFIEICQPTEEERRFLDHYKIHIYVLDRQTQVDEFILSDYLSRYKPPKNTQERYLGTTNFGYYFPIPVLVSCQGRHLRAADDRETAQIGIVTVHLGQMFIRRIKRGGGLPGWAEAGLGHHFEGKFNEYVTVSVIEYPFYDPPVDKWVDDWETFPLWAQNLAKQEVRDGLPSLAQLMEMPIEEIRVDALAKSWSLVTFLVEHRREAFFEFMRQAKLRFRGEVITPRQAFDKAFEPETPAQIEAAWVHWLETDPPRIMGAPMVGKPPLK